MSPSNEMKLPNSTRTDGEGSREGASIGSSEPQTFWEKVAETRWGKYISAIERHAILNAHSLFEKPTTALEVGCEGGRWTQLLDSLGWQMTSTDVNHVVLDMCQARVPRARCILVSSEEKTLPCETASLDLLLCVEVLPVAQSDWFLNEASRVLRLGGVLVTVVSNSLSVRGVAYRIFTTFDGERKQFRNESGIYSTTYRSLRMRMTVAGFEVVREEGMCWLPFSRESNSPLIPLLTNLEQSLGLRHVTVFSPLVIVIARKARLNMQKLLLLVGAIVDYTAPYSDYLA